MNLPNLVYASPDQWNIAVAGLSIVDASVDVDVLALYGIFTSLWTSDERVHGTVMLAIAAWLTCRNGPAMQGASQRKSPSAQIWSLVVKFKTLGSAGGSLAAQSPCDRLSHLSTLGGDCA